VTDTPVITSASKQIDFTRLNWGHSFSIFKKHEDGSFKICCWVTPGPKVGDTVKWETNYGYCVLRVDSVDWCRDPSDMYWLNVTPIERYDKEGNRLDAQGNHFAWY
jgi:hypothetical protein